MKYNEIDFGELSAEEEIHKNPKLISDCFYDYKSSVQKILQQNGPFLILGNKGSGKSIMAEHINQTNSPSRFVTKYGMREFPYKSFAKIIPGNDAVESKLPTAWQWALYTTAISSLINDNGLSHADEKEFISAVESLKSIGILPCTELKDIARVCSSNNFKVKVTSHFEVGGEKNIKEPLETILSNVIAKLKIILQSIRSESSHYIIIDGLDDQLSGKNHQFEIIACLIEEAKNANHFLNNCGFNAKIIVLCRKDIYTKLPGSNKNKNTGYTIDLNWYQDQIKTKDKDIIKLAEFRAHKSGESGSIFEKYFRAEYGNRNSLDYILENTRYTPRDFLRLLTQLKEFYRDDTFTQDDIQKAVKKYSTDYFWPEIEDELDGYFDRETISTFKSAIMHQKKREFKIGDFVRFCQEHDYNIPDCDKIFETLYNCGAVSNVLNQQYFSKMKDANNFNPKLNVSIHIGAFKALNL